MLWPFMKTGGFVHAPHGERISLFTLGFATEGASPPRLLVFACSCRGGLWIVALQIVPISRFLYGAFNRREVLVTMLDSGGITRLGPELLARSELVDNVQTWEASISAGRSGRDVAETHASYRCCFWFRSPHPDRSWVIGLLAVMDAAAMQLATQPLEAPSGRSRLSFEWATCACGPCHGGRCHLRPDRKPAIRFS